MNLLDKTTARGAAVAIRVATRCGVTNPKATTALTPPGYRAACVTFTRITSDQPTYSKTIAALEAAGFYPDTLWNGWTPSECSQAFIDATVYKLATPEELAP